MADSSVRPARLVDVDDVVAVQRRAFAALPPGAWPLPDLDGLDAGEMSRAWERAVLLPPSPAHRVLVATAGDDVVGVAVVEPAADPDLRDAAPAEDEREGAAATVASEVSLLLVDPPARRSGHGSRLLAAVADLSREAGVQELTAWLPSSDDDALRFLAGAGWAPDGAHRSVELTADDGSVRTVRELRYATALGSRDR